MHSKSRYTRKADDLLINKHPFTIQQFQGLKIVKGPAPLDYDGCKTGLTIFSPWFCVQDLWSQSQVKVLNTAVASIMSVNINSNHQTTSPLTSSVSLLSIPALTVSKHIQTTTNTAPINNMKFTQIFILAAGFASCANAAMVYGLGFLFYSASYILLIFLKWTCKSSSSSPGTCSGVENQRNKENRPQTYSRQCDREYIVSLKT